MRGIKFFDEEELEFLNSPEQGKYFRDVEKNLMEPLFSITDLGLAARDASYWDDKKILPNHSGPGKRRKYNIIQGTWIKLVQQLREIGVSTAVIKLLKDNVFEEKVTLNDVLKNKETKAAFEEYMESIGQLGSLEKHQDNVEKNKTNLSTFGLLIKYCVVFRNPLSLMVFMDGTYLPNTMKNLLSLNEQYSNVDDILDTPHVSISISKAYQELVVGSFKKPFFGNTALISEQEKEILEALKEPNLKSVEVRTKDGVLDILAICKEQKLDPATRVSDIISKNGYHSIEIKTRKGIPISYENKMIKKLNRT